MPDQSILPDNWQFRPMVQKDVEPILKIIRNHDTDDFKWASKDFEKAGLDNKYVLGYKGKATGVTGFTSDDSTDGTCWLSWTYLNNEHRGKGLGRSMLTSLFNILLEIGLRKIYVSTSDYEDMDEGSIYAAAIKLYESIGFRIEIVHEDYYQPGEAELLLGCRLRPLKNTPIVIPKKSGIVLKGLFEIQETHGAYALDWEFQNTGHFAPETMKQMIRKAKERGARSIFIALPSNIIPLNDLLTQCEFKIAGRLIDFYADGIHEFHFRYDF